MVLKSDAGNEQSDFLIFLEVFFFRIKQPWWDGGVGLRWRGF